MTESTVVVGVDGSAGADHALRWARAWARRTGAVVRAVMTWEVPAYMYSPSPLGVSTPPLELVESSARATLDEAMARAEEGAGPLTAVLRHGPPVTALLDDVTEHDASLLVVGTRGMGPIRRALLGSVSARLASDAPCPVAVVPEEAPVDADGPVAIGVDGSVGSLAALAWAGSATDRPLHAVHVYEYPFGPELAVEGLEFTDHETYGQQLVDAAVADALGDRAEVTTEVVSGDARDALIEVAEERGAALIAVGARAEKGLRGMGSVATSVSSEAKVPVVVVPVH